MHKTFLSFTLLENTSHHTSLSRLWDRLPLSDHEQVFTLVLQLAYDYLLLTGFNVQGQRTLCCWCDKDLEQELIVPTAQSPFHRHTFLVRVLFQ